MLGLLSVWNDLLTCTIMTLAANQDLVQLHDSMPVIFNREEQDAWLRGSTDREIGAGARVTHHPIKPFGTKTEGADLIEPV